MLVSVLGASRLCAASFVRLEFEIVWNLISKAWFPNPCQPFQITEGGIFDATVGSLMCVARLKSSRVCVPPLLPPSYNVDFVFKVSWG